MDELDGSLHLEQCLAVDHLVQRQVVLAALDAAGQHLPLGVHARVAEARPEQEAVELSLGQRIRPLVLDRVLGCEDEERALQGPRDPVRRHLTLLHRLEQRGLRLRRGAVDLVGEEEVREDRAGAELEVAVALVPDRRAGHVCGEQVGRELDAAEAEPAGLGEGSRRQRLREPRDVLEQDVAVREHAEQDQLELLALADDGALDLVDEAGTELCELTELHQTLSNAVTTRPSSASPMPEP